MEIKITFTDPKREPMTYESAKGASVLPTGSFIFIQWAENGNGIDRQDIYPANVIEMISTTS
jgi:hypothetical protein